MHEHHIQRDLHFWVIDYPLGKTIYFKSANTVCEAWLACANIAVAAWVMICERAKLVVSVA
jgi:hypothetical protein